MPYVDPEFVVPTVPEDEMYEGTEIDKNVLDGEYSAWKDLQQAEFGKLSNKSSSTRCPYSLGSHPRGKLLGRKHKDRCRACGRIKPVVFHEGTTTLFAGCFTKAF
jgi:hypothetical protein